MTARTLYVETSVWGSLAPRQPRDRKQVVQRLLRLLDGIRAVAMISRAVLIEIEAAPPEYSHPIVEAIRSVRAKVLPITTEIEALARAYIEAGVLPEPRETDAQHVAAATSFQLDYLVSWNHRHMTRPMKRLQYQRVNRLRGYFKMPLICNPFEACDDLRHR